MNEIVKIGDINAGLVLALILPGFISIRVWELIVPTGGRPLKDVIFESIAFSVINAVLLYPVIDKWSSTDNIYLFYVFTVLIFLFAPILWPLIAKKALNWAAAKNWILRRPKSGWDDFFSRRQACWIIAHLKDGRRIGGYYGAQSYATLYPQSGHIYIEELWHLDEETGAFESAVSESGGIILRPDDYHFIEIKGVQES